MLSSRGGGAEQWGGRCRAVGRAGAQQKGGRYSAVERGGAEPWLHLEIKDRLLVCFSPAPPASCHMSSKAVEPGQAKWIASTHLAASTFCTDVAAHGMLVQLQLLSL